MPFSPNSKLLRLTLVATCALLAAAFFTHISLAQNATPVSSDAQPYVIDYYYKIKWGHADEFLFLFKTLRQAERFP